MGIYPPKIRIVQQKRNQEIRRLYKSGKYTYQDLADTYKVSRQRVEVIVNSESKY